MGIQQFPVSLQPILQQGMLEREFEQAMRSSLAYRMIADRMSFKNGIGETITKTRAGLKASVTSPLSASSNTNLDNGLTGNKGTMPGQTAPWAVEQFTLSINQYADTQDLNTVTSQTGIKEQFLQNAYANGEQAARSLDELARNALFAAYMTANTFVRTTLGAAGTSVAVDDVRGFQYAPTTAGFTSAAAAFAAGAPAPTMQPVSASNLLTVTVQGVAYSLTSVAVDGANVSITPGGLSGVLTFTAPVTVANGTLGNGVSSAIAPAVIRPSGRASSFLLQASDLLTMANILDAKAKLAVNNVPRIDGFYNLYLDPVSSRQLFADPDFKQLFQGATSEAAAYKQGVLEAPFLGVRFMPTTEAYVQAHPTLAGAFIRRPILVGKGALIEGDFEGMATENTPVNAMIERVDGVCMVTREPLDRLQQIIAQSWYWIGGFCAPTDVTTNPTTIPTATNSAYKRGVMIEHIG